MKFIALPNGLIINLEHVASISAKQGAVRVTFLATYSIDKPQPMKVDLHGANAENLIQQIGEYALTEHLRNAFEGKSGTEDTTA